MDLTEDHLWTLGVPEIKKILLANGLARFGNKGDLVGRLLEFQSGRQRAKERKEQRDKEEKEGNGRARGSGGVGSPVGGEIASSSSSSRVEGGTRRVVQGGTYPSVLNPVEPPPFPPQNLPLNTNRLPLNYIAAPTPSRLISSQGVSFPLAFSATPHPHPSPPSSSSSAPLPQPQQHPQPFLGSSSSQANQFFFEHPPQTIHNPPTFNFPNSSSTSSSQHLFPPPFLQPSIGGAPSKRKSPHSPTSDDFRGPQPPLQKRRSTTFDLQTVSLVAQAPLPPDSLQHQPNLPPTSSSSKQKPSIPHPSASSSSSLNPSEPLPVVSGAPWRRVLSRQIFCEGFEVGSMRASFVRRETIVKGKFHEVLCDADTEMGEFGLECFDADGRVRVELTKGKESGSGAWGSEISRGTFIYLHEIDIHSPHHRSQGLGLTSFRALLGLLDRMKSQTVLSYIPSFIFAHPRFFDPLGDSLGPVASSSTPPIRSPEEVNHVTERAVEFFRRVGFRRVGRTKFFGYATTDINHPSRRIPLGSDSTLFPSPPPNHHQLHPVQYLLSSSSSSSHLSQTLFTCPLDLIAVQDHLERTPLHVAAQHGLLVPCQILLQRSRSQLFVTDSRGLTPLEELRRALRREREERVARGLDGEDPGRGEEERLRWKEKLDCERFLEVESRSRG